MNIARIACLASAAALAAVAAPVSAATIIDTGSPTGNSSYVITQPILSDFTYGAVFTLSDATSLTTIGGYFATTASSAMVTATIALASGSLPGESLFNTSFSVPQNNGATLTSGSFGTNTLAAGTYFALFSGLIPSDNINETLSIRGGAPTASTTEVFRNNANGSGYQTTNAGFAFRIEGDPDVTAGAVPEPATWAMMIVGFGIAAGALRRRRLPIAIAYA